MQPKKKIQEWNNVIKVSLSSITVFMGRIERSG